MKVALIGYGKMGKMIERLCQEKGHTVTGIVDPGKFGNAINAESLGDAEVCIEFTSPESVLDNLTSLMSLGKNVVVGTTGWEPHLDRIKQEIETHQTGLLFASNFSLGMHLFTKVLKEAAKTVMPTGQYDIAGLEAHHKQKLDSPSGTALTIAKEIGESLDGTIEVPFSSVRCGSIPGTHTVLFDSAFDTITLTHTARSREGFAQGAVTAAEWLKGRQGFYTMDDLLFSGESAC